jgi:hypothetical protein
MTSAMTWKSVLTLGVAAAASALPQMPSMHPRPNIHDYQVQAKIRGATLAATVLTPSNVKNSFTIDLASKGYTVVEVAFYPDQGSMKISPEDFTLRTTGEKSSEMRPIAPSVIARALGKTTPSQTPSIKSPVDVSMSSTIGVGTYPTYDQNGRPRQTSSGVYGSGVGVGVGVGVGSQGRSVPDRIPDNDRSSLEAELANRALPDDNVSQPSAGYLYFRNPSSKKKDVAYELQYAPTSDAGPTEPVKLVIPKPEGK